MSIDIKKLKNSLPSICEILPDLKRKNANEFAGPCPFPCCDAHNDGFVYFVKEGRYLCRKCSPKGGDIVDFHMKLEGLDLKSLAAKYLDPEPAPPVKQTETGRYKYHDESGKVLYYKIRLEPGREGRTKEFIFKHGNATGRGCESVLYNLPGVNKAEIVYIVEGEKKADLLNSWDLCSTSLDSGSNSKLSESMIEHLSGKNIIILPDNDTAGRIYRDMLTSGLQCKVASLKVIDLPGLSEKGDIIDWKDAGNGKAELLALVEAAPGWEPLLSCEPAPLKDWELARHLFPRISFPFKILPKSIGRSLQQLARSHATTPDALPGVAFCILASLLGSTITVKVKSSWSEPLIFWIGDIRGSGAGKTPAASSLCRLLYETQNQANQIYEKALSDWNKFKPKEKAQQDKPERARGYFVTDLTLEGIQKDISEHGGIVAILAELSAFLSSQNAYKPGADREAWLTLWDGKPARIVRADAEKTRLIRNARISIFGGVQPEVWRRMFSGKNKLYQADGTMYRFLLTTDSGGPLPLLTSEIWTEENRAIWEYTLKAAMIWADSRGSGSGVFLKFDDPAFDFLSDWRNELFSWLRYLPPIFQGFVPKMISYALRLSGILYCLSQFVQGLEPTGTLGVPEVAAGIEAAKFYMSNVVDACEMLTTEKPIKSKFEASGQLKYLIETLQKLRPDVDNGRLAIGYIYDKFHENCRSDHRISTPKALGQLLRSAGLTISDRNLRANNRESVRCLMWNDRIETLLKDIKSNSEIPNTS